MAIMALSSSGVNRHETSGFEVDAAIKEWEMAQGRHGDDDASMGNATYLTILAVFLQNLLKWVVS